MRGGHSDNLDEAAELQQKLNDSATAKVRNKLAPEIHPDFDGKHCVDCADDMPKLRLKMRRVRCVICQTVKEKRDKK